MNINEGNAIDKNLEALNFNNLSMKLMVDKDLMESLNL